MICAMIFILSENVFNMRREIVYKMFCIHKKTSFIIFVLDNCRIWTNVKCRKFTEGKLYAFSSNIFIKQQLYNKIQNIAGKVYHFIKVMSVPSRWSKPRYKTEVAHKEEGDWDLSPDSPWWFLILRSSGSDAPHPRTRRGQPMTPHPSHHSTDYCRE